MVDAPGNYVREQQIAMWSGAAAGWRKHRNAVSSHTQPVTEKLIEMAEIRVGDHVVDLACGVGDPALAIAQLVGDSGNVLALDVTEEMLEGARTFAQQQNIVNIDFKHIGSELRLDLPPAHFDVATCRFGLMFMPHPTRVATELARAIKAGGRLVIATWSTPDRCPEHTFGSEIIRQYVDLPAAAPTAPGMFSLSDPVRLSQIFAEAGFTGVRTVPVTIVENTSQSPEEYWEQKHAIAGGLRAIMASQSREIQESVRSGFIQLLRETFPDGAIHLTAEALVTVGVKQ